MDRYPLCLFDVDGTFRRPPTVGCCPTPPPLELSHILRGIRASGIKLGAATGASLDGFRLVERQMHFRMDFAAVSYGTRVIHRGVPGGSPSEHWLALKAERDTFRLKVVPVLDTIAGQYRAIVDDRSGVFTMFLEPGSDAFRAAATQVGEVVAKHSKRVRYLANPDGGITVLPLSGGKQLVINHLVRLGHTILVAAGDTGSDEPLIRHATFPIVTRTQEGSVLNQRLVDIVNERGVGYIAKEDEPNAIGLIQGLLAARQAGIVSF